MRQARARYWVRLYFIGAPMTFWYCTKRSWERERRILRRQGVWYAAGRLPQ